MYFKGETNGLSSRGKKPHERGIVFRDFDVSRLVSVINQASIICKLFIVINNSSLQQVKDFEDLVRAVVGHCSVEEQERLREMEDWIVKVFASS